MLVFLLAWSIGSCATVDQSQSTREQEVQRKSADVKARLDAADKAFAEGQFAEAEREYRAAVKQAGQIPRGNVPLSGNPLLALSHLGLALFYLDQDRYPQAMALFQTSLPDLGLFFGPKDGLVGTNLVGQAVIHLINRDTAKAEGLIYRAAPILRDAGAQHGTTRIIANVGLAIVLLAKSETRTADSLLNSNLSLLERADEPQHHRIAARLLGSGTASMRTFEPQQAEVLIKRTLAVIERIRGPQDIGMAEAMESYGVLLRSINRGDEAEVLETRAKAIREKRGN